jgi:hypothetical protein
MKAPNAIAKILRPIHNRMPVIYDREMAKQWLEHSFGDRAMTLAAVTPFCIKSFTVASAIASVVTSSSSSVTVSFFVSSAIGSPVIIIFRRKVPGTLPYFEDPIRLRREFSFSMIAIIVALQ